MLPAECPPDLRSCAVPGVLEPGVLTLTRSSFSEFEKFVHRDQQLKQSLSFILGRVFVPAVEISFGIPILRIWGCICV